MLRGRYDDMKNNILFLILMLFKINLADMSPERRRYGGFQELFE